jgi:hypothetical protein
VEWESAVWNGKGWIQDNCWKVDESLRSFLFTLKNPHNISARRFALKSDKKWRTVRCDYE